MSGDWEEARLADIADLVGGGTPSTARSEYWGGDIPWVTTTELTAANGSTITGGHRTLSPLGLASGAAKKVRSGAVLVGTTATIGTVARAAGELAFNQQITGVIRTSRDMTDEYLFRWMQFVKPELCRLAAGTAFLRVSSKSLLELPVRYPCVATQHRIVDLLDSADRLVRTLENEATAASLASSELSTKLLSDVRNRVPIGSLLTERKDQLTIDDDTLYTQVTVSGAGRGMRLRERKHGRDIGTKKQTVLQQDELVVSRIDARKGAMCVVPPDFAGAIVTSSFPCFAIDQTKALPPYVDLVVRSAAFARTCDVISAGTTNRVAVDMKRFGGLEVPLPSLDEQRCIVDLVAIADARLRASQDKADAAQTLRDQLLHDLLSGAHAIPESYDRFLTEAAS